MDKHSSLIQKYVIYGRKIFITLAPDKIKIGAYSLKKLRTDSVVT